MTNWPFSGSETHTIYDCNELFDLLENAGFRRSKIEIREVNLPLAIKGFLASAVKSAQNGL